MERLRTVPATCEKQSRDVPDFPESCLRAFWNDASPPTPAADPESYAENPSLRLSPEKNTYKIAEY